MENHTGVDTTRRTLTGFCQFLHVNSRRREQKQTAAQALFSFSMPHFIAKPLQTGMHIKQYSPGTCLTYEQSMLTSSFQQLTFTCNPPVWTPPTTLMYTDQRDLIPIITNCLMDPNGTWA